MTDFKDIFSATLISKKGNVSGDVLNGKVILLYFSAHWCPPCRTFTPLLKKYYEGLVALNKPVAVVFVSCDEDEEGMMNYFKTDHGDYYCLPFDSPLRDSLSTKYGVQGIPTLLVVDKNGAVITKTGRDAVQSQDYEEFEDWESKSKK